MTRTDVSVKVDAGITPDLPVVSAAVQVAKPGQPQPIAMRLRSLGEQELQRLTRMPQSEWMNMVRNESLKSETGNVTRTAIEVEEGGNLRAYHYRISMKPDQFKQALSMLKQVPAWRANRATTFDYLDGYAEVSVRPPKPENSKLRHFQPAIAFADRVGRFLQLVFEDGAEISSAVNQLTGIVLSSTRERESETSARDKLLRKAPKNPQDYTIVTTLTSHRSSRRWNLSPRHARPDIDVDVSFVPRKSSKDPKRKYVGDIMYG